ncbi:hypothetical protein Q8W71_22030 [Methylobacterium sp. NEAU 140]|nr:hypothetical protein [Methylobacterium sp. NEAU 140]MDP4025314.1 hypothetical protein [Methylobacterium sp. NEAU 140]
MALFLALNRELGITVLIVTHNPIIAACCPRRIAPIVTPTASSSRVQT